MSETQKIPSETEDARCAMCNRRVQTQAPYALCRRCEDELNRGPERAA